MNLLRSGVLVGLGVVAGSACCSWAAVVDLTTFGSSGTANGALFEQSAVRAAGSGVINAFLRMQNNPSEQGYNTSGRPAPFDDLTDLVHTHDIQVSDLVTRNINGTDYYEFLLDTNEPNGGGQNLISLDKLQLFTSATGSQTTTSVSSLGTLRYDLDAGGDNSVLIDDTLTSGSGQSDARIFIPVSDLAGSSSSDFVYLYAQFGNTNASEGGFEEFALQSPNTTTIPLPTVGFMGLAGLSGLGMVRRRR